MSVQSEEDDSSRGVDEVELEESDQKNHLDQHTNETLSDEHNGTKQEQLQKIQLTVIISPHDGLC